MEIISRAEAKAQGMTRYFTGKPCPHGHVCERRVSDCQCVKCSNDSYQKWRKEYPEKHNETSRKWLKSNPEKMKKIHRKKREKAKRNAAALDTLALLANLSKLKEMETP